MAISPSACTMRCQAMGATNSGWANVRPSSSMWVLKPESGCSTRGNRLRRSQAMLLARSVISSPAPPLK
jgi:hypothetical protein